ncbi:HAD family hydrolase [Urechidicola sp. KH5]
MKLFQNFQILLVLSVLIVACSPPNKKEKTQAPNYLNSWNEGSTKQAIIDYVEVVTDPRSIHFIPIEDRVATFDNDGTLWSEQPAYFQLFFAIDMVKSKVDEHPEWRTEQPFKAVLENDIDSLISFGEKGLIEIIMATHAGITTVEFEQEVVNWLNTAKHPRFDKPYYQLVYQPMLELLEYLSVNNFKTYIVSGGGIEFMRPWTEKVYGIPPDQVIGSNVEVAYDYNNGKPVIRRLPKLHFIDDKDGKPVGIHRYIGKKPVFASGNSDGDLQMLQWTDSNSYKSFQLYLHHTDDVREWAYDRESHIGKLNKGLDEAQEKGWTIIDMKNDWKVIYPHDLKK